MSSSWVSKRCLCSCQGQRPSAKRSLIRSLDLEAFRRASLVVATSLAPHLPDGVQKHPQASSSLYSPVPQSDPSFTRVHYGEGEGSTSAPASFFLFMQITHRTPLPLSSCNGPFWLSDSTTCPYNGLVKAHCNLFCVVRLIVLSSH